jgi:hypothetical protein
LQQARQLELLELFPAQALLLAWSPQQRASELRHQASPALQRQQVERPWQSLEFHPAS